MTQLLVVVVGLIVGFGGARVLRRPARTSGAASVARSVGGAVGGRRDLDLPHLQRSVLSEMMRTVDSRSGAGQVPAAFVVRLHPDDYETVDQAPGFFKQGLEEAMDKAGRDHGWTVPPRLRIDLTSDPSRHRGAPSVDATAGAVPQPAVPSPSPSPSPSPRLSPSADSGASSTATAPSTGGARLEGSDGRRHGLTTASVTIGRGTDQTIRIVDSRVSRHHATISASGRGYTVTDDGSSNGTRRNDQPLVAHSPAPLTDGDRVAVGPITFVFRSGSGA